MDYQEVTFCITPYTEAVADALMAGLGEIGYDGFTYTDNGFKAYIPQKDFDETLLRQSELLQFFSQNYTIGWESAAIEDRDWNKEWEDHFTPILIDDQILIRAGFHPTIAGISHEIIIEPKMSFGTGHHATTALMLRTILEYAPLIQGKRVLDMGCGTGILSIMASKAGAQEVTGIDIDEWAFNNAMENLQNNNISNVKIKIGDAALLAEEKPFEVILANINRNILLHDMGQYVRCLASGGYLIMSGFYLHDLPQIQEKARQSGLSFKNYQEEKEWVAAVFHKN